MRKNFSDGVLVYKSFVSCTRHRLQRTAGYRVLAGIKRGLRAAIKAADELDTRVVSLQPHGPARGRMLLSYITSPFFLKDTQPIPYSHAHYWESREIAHTFLELGYAVDVIHFKNLEFLPGCEEYSVVVDARRNLERLAPKLPRDCVKIMHIDTAHVLFHNAAEARRLLELKERRGFVLRPRRFEMPNAAIEHADCGTMLGTEFSTATFRYANKPLYRLPLASPLTYEWQGDKNFETCRRNFLWFGSGGMVHKGLDLVLDAFAGMPELSLTVCGPVQREGDFARAYHRELYELPNIRTIGWVDIGSAEFRDIVRNAVALVYPSCSEGASGSVIGGMHAGLIPIASCESSVDEGAEFGVVLPKSGVQEIRDAIAEVAGRPALQLENMARGVWEAARARHTREHFAREYRAAVGKILKEHG